MYRFNVTLKMKQIFVALLRALELSSELIKRKNSATTKAKIRILKSIHFSIC